MPWRQVVDIGSQLCRALKHAHDRGILHRDIKPANIMMTRENQVKLSDFGIARLYGNTSLTMEGGPIGTANYMSPEQTEGKKVTERSDLYCLGCTLYALLAGRPPFVSDSLYEMLNMHRNSEPPPVSRFAPDVPPELGGILRTLLSKKPEDRMANASVLLRSLQMVERSQAMLHDTTIEEPNPAATIIAGTMDAPATGLPPTAVPTQMNLAATARQGVDASAATTAPGMRSTSPRVTTGQGAAGADDLQATVARTSPTGVAPPTGQETGTAASGATTPHTETAASDTTTARAAPRLMAGGKSTAPRVGEIVTVEEAGSRRDRQAQQALELQEQRARLRQYLAGMAMLVLILGAVTGIGWYFVYYRPYLPDQVYARIELADQMESPGREKALVDENKDIADFLYRFPKDPRAAEIRPLQDEVNLLVQENKLSAAAILKHMFNDKPLPTIERLYDEAVSHAKTGTGHRRGQTPGKFWICMPARRAVPWMAATKRKVTCNWARWKMNKLRQQANAYTLVQLQFVRTRLDAIQGMKSTNPEQARRACRALIEIFSGRPWAEASLRRAQGILDSLSAATRPARTETLPNH